jgi:hypothetical protein
MTTSTATISKIIIRQIAHITTKANTAKCHEAALKVVHADSNEDMQADTKINHGRKSATYVRNLSTG